MEHLGEIEPYVLEPCGIESIDEDSDEEELNISSQQEFQESILNGMMEIDSSNKTVVETPWVGMEFPTVDAAFIHYNSYALKTGFGIRREARAKSSKLDGRYISSLFVCNKAGRKWENDKRETGKNVNRRGDTRVGCKARLRIKLKNDGIWSVSKFEEKHNGHDLITSPDKVIHHYSHKQAHRSKANKQLMYELHTEGIAPSKVARVLNVINHSEGDILTGRQCQDQIRHVKENNIGHECMTLIRMFQDRKEFDPDFYFAVEIDYMGTMRSLFWADGRARSSYLRFGDVVVFDVTYKTNNWNLPFAPFTGVNHHMQSTLFGCALLADEDEETFTWLFTQWLKCMHGIPPKTIITDQDKGMRGAIKNVLQNTRHRYCSWHIAKHIAEHTLALQSLYGEKFPDYFSKWYHGKNVEHCEQYWKDIKGIFGVKEEGNGWLQTMYREREYWVNAYLKDVFWAGMTTSQRSESINAFFDGYVNAKTQINDFVKQYDKAIADRRRKETQEDFMTLNHEPVLHFSNKLELQVGKVYTREILKLFQLELIGTMSVQREVVNSEGLVTIFRVGLSSDDKSKWDQVTFEITEELKMTCSCALFETFGILCKHILHIMMFHYIMEVIPEHYILPRWTRSARHRSIALNNISTVRNNASTVNQSSTLYSWVLTTKFRMALDISQGDRKLMHMLEKCLEVFTLNAEKEISEKQVQHQLVDNSQVGSSNATLLLSQIPEASVRDPEGPVKTKGRPKKASRYISGLEESQLRNNGKKRRTCKKCGENGHYSTSCKGKENASTTAPREEVNNGNQSNQGNEE